MAFDWGDGSTYEGEWKDNQRYGKGTFKYADGDVYTGEWKDDIQNGKGIYKFKNGDVYEGDYVEGERTGIGICEYANGDKYTGEFFEGDKQGRGTIVWENGNVYVGDTYLYNNDVWRCVGIRGRNFPLTIKGSIIFNATGASKNINGTDYTSCPIINIGGDWNSVVASSIEIGENAAIDSKTGLKAAIILDTSVSKVYQNLYFGLATDQVQHLGF